MNPRIITGILKGFKLEVGKDTRPVTDRVKKTIFDILGDFVENSSVLDLFAGSGNFGIEAISRGASNVVFVDKAKSSIEALNNNLRKAKIEDKSKVITSDFEKFLSKNSEKFDLIFVDAPFELTSRLKLANFIPSLSQDNVLVIKIPTILQKKFPIPSGFEIIKEKKIGINYVYFLKVNFHKA